MNDYDFRQHLDRGNVIPVDFSAPRDGGAEDVQAAMVQSEGYAEPHLPEFIRREVAAWERAQRRDQLARVAVLLVVIGVLLAAFAYFTIVLVQLTGPLPVGLTGVAAEQPLNP